MIRYFLLGLALSTTAAAAQTFAPAVTLGTLPGGARPNALAAGDFDGDGDVDLATANVNSDNVSIFRNGGGTGTFAKLGDFPANPFPVDLAAADLDGDGDLDLAVANYDFTNPRVSILLNSGSGQFGIGQVLAVSIRPSGIVAADFDGDLDLDLAISRFDFGGSAVVLRNQGAAIFAMLTPQTTGQHSFGLAAGDLDDDGDPDLAVANDQAASVSILRNLGGGALAPAVAVPTPGAPSAVDVGDLDDDGDLDIAVANRAGNQVRVHWNDGAGGFPTSGTFNAGGGQLSVVIADLDCDGRNDLAVVANQPGKVGVLRYVGGQNFAPVKLLTVGNDPRDIVARDFGNNYPIDLATANTNASSVSILRNTTPAALGPMVFRAGIRGDHLQNPPPAGVEYASPSPALAAFLGASPNPVRPFDQALPNDSWFGHTFAGLPGGIVGASLQIRVRCGGANDSVSLGFDGVGAFAWSSQFAALTGGCPANMLKTFTLNLAALPGALLARLNADRRLDVFVQDDTPVDWLQLRILVCKRTPVTLTVPTLQQGQVATLTATGVAGPPNTLVAFVGSSSGVDVGTWLPSFDTRLCLNLPGLFFIGFGWTDASGTATFAWTVPPGPAQQYLSVQAAVPVGGGLTLSNTVTAPVFP